MFSDGGVLLKAYVEEVVSSEVEDSGGDRCRRAGLGLLRVDIPEDISQKLDIGLIMNGRMYVCDGVESEGRMLILGDFVMR